MQIQDTLQERTADRAVLATVVPDARDPWDQAVRSLCGAQPLWVGCRTPLGIPITYPNPETIGADRLANASAAAGRYGVPVIVVDFGTALTFDVILPDQGFVGGVIAPGPSLMLDYLADRTARLPSVKPAPVRRVVGKSTEESMRIGAHYGYWGMVRGILDPLTANVGTRGLTLCATGGHARRLPRAMLPDIRIVPELTLFGLGHIGELNLG